MTIQDVRAAFHTDALLTHAKVREAIIVVDHAIETAFSDRVLLFAVSQAVSAAAHGEVCGVMDQPIFDACFPQEGITVDAANHDEENWR